MTRPTRSLLLLLLVAAALVGEVNCRDPSKRRNSPISATFAPATAASSGQVAIPYLLRHHLTTGIAIQPMYSLDGGYSYGFATPGPGGDGVVNLTANASGIMHSFVWDSVADIGYAARIVVFEVVAFGGRAGTSLSSPIFLVANATALATPLTTARSGHSATLLSDGRILIAGGRDTNGQVLGITELFDPDKGTIGVGASLKAARSGHAAVLLADGRVLIAGGRDAFVNPLGTTELYTPAAGAAGAFVPGADLTTPRVDAGAARLADGRVLLTGGLGALGTAHSATEIYTPAPAAAGAFAAAAPMNVARRRHTATTLGDGRVLIAGGGRGLDSAETYDAATNSFTALAGTLRGGRGGHSANRLADGRVFLVGGEGPSGERADVEFFDPAANAFARLRPLAPSIQNAATVVLADGRLLLLGGSSGGQAQVSIIAYRPLD